MPQRYPLESLLSVRHYREEEAARAVARAQSALKAARVAERAKEKALIEWRAWREEEVRRRYEALMGRAVPVKRIFEFNQGLSELNARELDLAAVLEKARGEVKRCEAEAARAKSAASLARKNAAKIETHRSIWQQDAKREAERQEDLEFEEFKAPRKE